MNKDLEIYIEGLTIEEKKELKKRIITQNVRNNNYYENNKEKHLNYVKQKYQDVYKHNKQYCSCYQKDYLKIKFHIHLKSLKHKKHSITSEVN